MPLFCSVYQAMAEGSQHLSNLQSLYLVARGFSYTVYQKTQGSMTSLYFHFSLIFYCLFASNHTRPDLDFIKTIN